MRARRRLTEGYVRFSVDDPSSVPAWIKARVVEAWQGGRVEGNGPWEGLLNALEHYKAIYERFGPGETKAANMGVIEDSEWPKIQRYYQQIVGMALMAAAIGTQRGPVPAVKVRPKQKVPAAVQHRRDLAKKWGFTEARQLPGPGDSIPPSYWEEEEEEPDNPAWFKRELEKALGRVGVKGRWGQSRRERDRTHGETLVCKFDIREPEEKADLRLFMVVWRQKSEDWIEVEVGDGAETFSEKAREIESDHLIKWVAETVMIDWDDK